MHANLIHRIAFASVALASGALAARAAAAPPSDSDILRNPYAVLYSSSAMQSRIVTDKPLADVALQNTRLGAGGQSFGFAAKSPEARFFLVGAFYSETLALARGGKLPDAARRIAAIERILIDLGAPSGLYAFTVKVKSHLDRGDLPVGVLREYLSLFQPLFSDYAKAQSADKLALFTTGLWVTDMGLAAGAGDVSMLRDDAMLKRVIADMKRLDAPKGVQEALGDIATISSQKEIGKRDAKTVLDLVQRIQTLLG